MPLVCTKKSHLPFLNPTHEKTVFDRQNQPNPSYVLAYFRGPRPNTHMPESLSYVKLAKVIVIETYVRWDILYK